MKIKKWIMLVIKVMIVVGIIATIAAVFVIPNIIIYEYKKSYCTATVSDVGAIGGALEDYFANPANVTATTLYNPPGEGGHRPFILVGADNTGAYKSNTLLLSASTMMPGEAPSVPTAAGIGHAAAGAFKKGANYVVYACEGAGNCPRKISWPPPGDTDTHWVNDPISQVPSYSCYFRTL
ncbi:hypothetical protein [Candidatus Electronema sp. PJ]|uniref:hypothetical protein n=1 Tax=Candidatus Electronema sp. PJ TaxID=3401572 RepID=UPI003AA886AB